jgi:hypothetical protein
LLVAAEVVAMAVKAAEAVQAVLFLLQQQLQSIVMQLLLAAVAVVAAYYLEVLMVQTPLTL